MNKASREILENRVFRYLGARDPSVVLGPRYGEDAAVIHLGGETLLLAHVDPITCARKLAGYLAVYVSTNDVAVEGGDPRWLLVTILAPLRDGVEGLETLLRQIDEAAKRVGVAIVGGHTEFVDRDAPTIVATAIGTAPLGCVVTTGGARVGDLVVLGRFAAIEGTAILATDLEEELVRRGVPRRVVEEGKRFIHLVTLVDLAKRVREAGPSSMHDPTEGGVLGGLYEIAYASRVSIVVYEERIPIAPQTSEICRALGIDPLKLISSGTLLATASRESVVKMVRAGLDIHVIGEVVEGEGEVILVRSDGKREILDKPVEDEIYRVSSSST